MTAVFPGEAPAKGSRQPTPGAPGSDARLLFPCSSSLLVGMAGEAGAAAAADAAHGEQTKLNPSGHGHSTAIG